MTLDLSDDEKLSLVALLKRAIGDDPYLPAPRVLILKQILSELEPPAAAVEPHPASRPGDRPAAAVRARARRRSR